MVGGIAPGGGIFGGGMLMGPEGGPPMPDGPFMFGGGIFVPGIPGTFIGFCMSGGGPEP